MASSTAQPIDTGMTPGRDLQALFEELVPLIKGPVYRPGDPEFHERIKTFNGKIKPLSILLVAPLDAKDVSAIVKFCTKNNLSPSVKAGGYGIPGWAVAGDVVIDMAMIREMDIEAPTVAEDGTYTWTRLGEMPLAGEKGKGVVGSFSSRASGAGPGVGIPWTATARPQGQTQSGSVKRRREDSPPESPQDLRLPPSPFTQPPDAHLRAYDLASGAVGSFLRGPPLPPVPGETPRQPPRNRPRVDMPGSSQEAHLEMPILENRQTSAGSSGSTVSRTTSEGDESMSRSDSNNTAMTSPNESPSIEKSPPFPRTGNVDPFGYIPGFSSTSTSSSGRDASMGHWGRPWGSQTSSSAVTAASAFFSAPASSGSGASSASMSAGFGVRASPFGFGPPPPVPASHLLSTSTSSTSPPHTQAPFSTIPGSGTGLPSGGVGGMEGTLADPIHPHAYVTFGAGMRQREIDLYTAENPLEGTSKVSGLRMEGVVPYHIPSSAHPVGSSIMLLAGFGFISRMHGLSVDNLVEVEMVLATGEIVILDKDTYPDLWWAIRGAGPAFGIATRYKVKAFPVPVVFAGNLIYRFHRATAPSLIKHFRDCIKNCPRELYANVLLTAGPADADSLVVIQMCYVGPKEKGMEYLQAISSWDGERCLLNEVNEKSYLRQQDSVAQILRGKSGRQWFLRSSLIHSLPDEVINKTVLQFANTPIGCTWIFELSGGAIADFEDTCIPKTQRSAIWTVAALHQWDMGIDDPRCIISAEEWMKETIGPVSCGGVFPTFLGRHEPPKRIKACYGTNWPQLASIKQKYDPSNLFRNCFWPVDEHGRDLAGPEQVGDSESGGTGWLGVKSGEPPSP